MANDKNGADGSEKDRGHNHNCSENSVTESSTNSANDNSPLLVTRILFRIRHGIEFCGKHPFVTGLFALIGLFGLALSIVSFNLDREDAKGTTEQVQRVEKKIDEINAELGSSKQTQGFTIDRITSPAGIQAAKDAIQEFYGNSISYVEIKNTALLDLDGDGNNTEIYIDYRIPSDDDTFIEVYSRKKGGIELVIQHKIDPLVRDYGLAPIIINGKPYLCFWEFGGSLNFGSILIYEQQSDGGLSNVWKSKPIINASVYIELGKLYVTKGGLNKEVLEIVDGKFGLRPIEEDLSKDPFYNSNISSNVIDLKIREVSSNVPRLSFEIDGKQLAVTPSPGKRKGYYIPWPHFTVKIDLRKRNLLRFLPINKSAGEYYGVLSWSPDVLEPRTSNNLLFLAKEAKSTFLLYERRYEETYRLEINVKE